MQPYFLYKRVLNIKKCVTKENVVYLEAIREMTQQTVYSLRQNLPIVFKIVKANLINHEVQNCTSICCRT